MLKNNLQIYLVTYNRKQKLKQTLEAILAFDSPIRDCGITLLDNASNDGTSELIDDYCAKYKNLKHIRHCVNIGGNANICRAFEMSASCRKDYAWIICDDDMYDFSNWHEVETYMGQGKDIICVSDYAFPKQEDKTNKAYQIFQMTFVPASIYKTKHINSTVLMNMYDAILTMFQQTCLTIHIINNAGDIAVLEKPIVYNGLHYEDNIDKEDISYTRGVDDPKEILARKKDTCWALGFCNVISLLNDKSLQRECMKVSILSKYIYGGFSSFYNHIIDLYFNTKNISYFYEIYKILPKKMQKELLLKCFLYKMQAVFSLKNSKDKKYKIVTILGLKFYIKRSEF